MRIKDKTWLSQKPFRQIFKFLDICPEASWQLTETEETKKNYYILGEGTFFLKKKGQDYEITDDLLKAASEPRFPREQEIEGAFKKVKEVVTKKLIPREALQFRGDQLTHKCWDSAII